MCNPHKIVTRVIMLVVYCICLYMLLYIVYGAANLLAAAYDIYTRNLDMQLT